MRTLSAADIKRKSKKPLRQNYPAPTSVAGRVLGYFKLRPGEGQTTTLVQLAQQIGITLTQLTTALQYLKDFYGIDIRCLKYGLWVFAGEWVNGTYVDHIARRNK